MNGISINEFLAGEDIPTGDIKQRSEENIISVSADSKKKQKRLKVVIDALLVIILAGLVAAAISIYRANQPQNFITPADKNSIEMETARILSGPDGAFIYNFTTTDEYKRFYINAYEYHSGQLYSKKCVMELGFDEIGSPENGVIFIVPDFEEYTVKLIFAADGYKMTTETTILEDVTNREYYGRGASEITEKTQVRYNEEQALLATEIVYALTNDKGRTRAERAGEKYYKGIRETPYAPFVKLCDRLANITYSCSGEGPKGTRMKEVYKSEMPHFLPAIDPHSNDPRFAVPTEVIEALAEILIDEVDKDEIQRQWGEYRF